MDKSKIVAALITLSCLLQAGDDAFAFRSQIISKTSAAKLFTHRNLFSKVGYIAYASQYPSTSITPVTEKQDTLALTGPVTDRTSPIPPFIHPVSELEREIGGKLYFVQALPGLSEDGTLIATYNPQGIRVQYVSRPWERDDTGAYRAILNADLLTTLHFSINTHPPSSFYLSRPFIVIIPLVQPPEYDILKVTISASFQEAIVLGNYKLPPNSIIMVRESELHTLPEYYKERFKIVSFNDLDETKKPNMKKKRDAVQEVLIEHNGFPIDLPDHINWHAMSVKDKKGEELNTFEFFKRLLPHGPVAFGTDGYTHPLSKAEQWRMACTRSNSATYHGELGFSIESYQNEKLNQWLDQFSFPSQAIENHKKVNRENSVALRAMDYIFDHFKNKRLSYDYIENHLKILDKKGIFKSLFTDESLKYKSIDDLAKVVCDYEYLKKQPVFAIPRNKAVSDEPVIDLATPSELIQRLFENSVAMQPDEATEFFNQFFSNSTIFSDFSKAEQAHTRKSITNLYALAYFNSFFTSKQALKKYKAELAAMLDPTFKVGAHFPTLYHVLTIINDCNIASSSNQMYRISQSEIALKLQKKFDETVLYFKN